MGEASGVVGVTVLGSTGTIGVNTLDVIARNNHLFQVVALTANADDRRLFQQCLAWLPSYAVMADEDASRSAEWFHNLLS